MPELALRHVLVRNTTVQMLAQAVALLTGLGNSLVLSRHLGVHGFGEFNYIFAFYYFFLTLNEFGINTIVVREVSQNRDRASALIGAMRTFKVGVSLLLLCGAGAVIWIIQPSAELRNAMWLFGLMLPILALQLPSAIFQVNLQAEYSAIVGASNRCLGFILVLLAVALGGGLFAVVGALVISELLALVLINYFSKNWVRPVWQIRPDIWAEVLRSSVPLGLAGLFSAVINRVDFLMLERLTDLHQVGLYSAAYKITNLLEAFPLMLMGTVYPLMSRWAKDDLQRTKRLYWRSVLVLGLVGLPVGAGVTIAAPWIVQLVFGSEFKETVPALRVLIWSTVALYLAISGGNLLISLGRERINLILNFCGATLNVCLNIWLIPIWGFIGAAWATTITFFFALIAINGATLLALNAASSRPALMELPSGHASVRTG